MNVCFNFAGSPPLNGAYQIFSVQIMHRRSRNKLLERRVRALIFSNAFVDTRRAETVCRLNRVDVLGMLNGPVNVGLVPPVMKGEVLMDSRGTGSFQH
jgi:hypothetical protein